MVKKIFISASLLGLIAVVLGAFAAHGLRSALSVLSLESFQTGVRYQMYHAFFSFCGWASTTADTGSKKSSFLAHYYWGSAVFGLYLFVVYQHANPHRFWVFWPHNTHRWVIPD